MSFTLTPPIFTIPLWGSKNREIRLARVVLPPPDGPTKATALSRLIADKTVLVIAHRMRTVAGADKIVVLSDGTVAEEGSPKDLEEKNGVYAHMVKLQTESQNWKLA